MAEGLERKSPKRDARAALAGPEGTAPGGREVASAFAGRLSGEKPVQAGSTKQEAPLWHAKEVHKGRAVAKERAGCSNTARAPTRRATCMTARVAPRARFSSLTRWLVVGRPFGEVQFLSTGLNEGAKDPTGGKRRSEVRRLS